MQAFHGRSTGHVGEGAGEIDEAGELFVGAASFGRPSIRAADEEEDETWRKGEGWVKL